MSLVTRGTNLDLLTTYILQRASKANCVGGFYGSEELNLRNSYHDRTYF
jgi:hypothetical protein